MLEPGVSHSFSEETPQAKARWFQSLSMEERMDVFCEFFNFLITVRPDLLEKKKRDARPIEGRIQVLSLDRNPPDTAENTEILGNSEKHSATPR